MNVRSRLLGRFARAAPSDPGLVADAAPSTPARDPLFSADCIDPAAADLGPAAPLPHPAGISDLAAAAAGEVVPSPAARHTAGAPMLPYQPSFLFAAGLIPGSPPASLPATRPPLRRRPVTSRPPGGIPFRRNVEPPVSHPFP